MGDLRVLLVGGNGFLGRHAAVALAERYDALAVLDCPGSADADRPGAPALPDECEQYAGSVTSAADVAEAVAASRPDVIVSLAAFGLGDLGLVRAAEEDPRGAVEVNALGLLHLLETVESRPGTRVVWTSSTTVYGSADRYDQPVDEHALIGPRSVYAVTKVLGEQLIRSYRARGGVEAVALRPTLVWGSGIRYRGVQSVLGDLVEAAARGREVSVPESDEPWDLLYVRDAGHAIAWLARVPDPPDIVLVNGYRASIDQVRARVLAARPATAITSRGEALRLGFPPVDDGAARRAGFAPAYDLDRSIEDYLSTVGSNAGSQGRES